MPELLEHVEHAAQARVARRVRDAEQAAAARRPEQQLEQALRDARVRAGQLALGRRLEPPGLGGEVDGEPLRAEQAGDVLDRGVERVRERELRDRLADDRQQRARALELDRERLPPLAGAQRVGGADGEGAEPVEQRIARVRLVGEQQLQRALRRLAELQRHDRAALLQRLDRERAGHVARAADGVERDRGRERVPESAASTGPCCS